MWSSLGTERTGDQTAPGDSSADGKNEGWSTASRAQSQPLRWSLTLSSSVAKAEGAAGFPAGKAQGSRAKFRTR